VAYVRVSVKIPFAEPGQLQPGWLAGLNDVVFAGAGAAVVGAAVRAGCIDLTLDLLRSGAVAPAGELSGVVLWDVDAAASISCLYVQQPSSGA
jgi:hypothetical protein